MKEKLEEEARRRNMRVQLFSDKPLRYQFIERPKVPRNAEIGARETWRFAAAGGLCDLAHKKCQILTSFSFVVDAKMVHVIDEKEVNLGQMQRSAALALAKSKELDLVAISNAEVPVCRIIGYGNLFVVCM